MNAKGETFETTTNAFGSLAALLADARGNALVLPDKARIHFAAGYLRLAARKSAALAELLDAVSTVSQRSGDRAKKRIREIDRDIEKFLDVVGKDSERMLKRHGGKVVRLSSDDAKALLAAVNAGGELPAHLFEAAGFEVEPEGSDHGGAEHQPLVDDPASATVPPTPGQDIREETMLPLECLAYQAWTELSDLAYKKDGIIGVLAVAGEAIQAVNESAEAASEAAPDCINMQRALVARYLGMDYLPSVCAELPKLPDGAHYWEDDEGNAVDFPVPGQRLRTAAESRAVGANFLQHFEVYQAAGGNVLPGFWSGIQR